MPYEDNFFDCVFDRCSIQHNSFKRQKRIISGIRRVLKKNGKFFSIQISETTAPLDFKTACLSKKEMRELVSIFKMFTLDYSIKTFDNQKEAVKEWSVAAIKS